MRVKTFINYVMQFYGPNGLYASFFKGGVTKKEVERAHRILVTKVKGHEFVGDSFDREMVRDIMFILRGQTKDLEYKFVLKGVKK